MIRLALIGLILSVQAAGAHTTDQPFAEWMMSLRQPKIPYASCCGPADQVYPERYEANEDGSFTAWVNGRKINVPADTVIWDRVNPTGRGVLFINQEDQFIFCFVPGSGT